METLLIAIGVGVAFIIAYHTYGRWLGRRIFNLAADRLCPCHRLRDDRDYVPTAKGVVFGHHFTSIAATGPIVGPAIAVMWGWLPALLWVVVGSIFIGAVHDFGSLVVSLRNNGQSVGDIAGRVLNRRVRLLFLSVLFLALTIIIAIFGLVIAAVFRQYPAAIFPVIVQIPIAIGIGVWLHRKGVSLVIPSIIALGLMYLAVILGNEGLLGDINTWFASWPTIVWVAVLLTYCYIASVLPVWVLLQPRDYINALQLISALGLVVLGLIAAAMFGGAPAAEGAERQPLELAAPMVQWNPEGAPIIFPFLFITIACGAISGFHCLVSSGTSSKQLRNEADAHFVGYGSMLTEGFLATIVILACVAGLGLGIAATGAGGGTLTGAEAFAARYTNWAEAGALGRTVGAFVDGSANFLAAMGIPLFVAVALMGVFVASFAATTLDSATRLQRYVIQELGRALGGAGYDGSGAAEMAPGDGRPGALAGGRLFNPAAWLTNRYAATLVAVVIAGALAAMPAEPPPVAMADAWAGGVTAEQAEEFGFDEAAAASVAGGGLAAAWAWTTQFTGTGGLILWPMFGATNQLMGGLAFLVIAFWLWRRAKPIWFIVLPLVFMLVMPAWAMLWQVFVANPGDAPGWLFAEDPQWVLIAIALATVALEIWMILEAVLLFPRARGVLEESLPGAEPEAQPEPAYAAVD